MKIPSLSFLAQKMESVHARSDHDVAWLHPLVTISSRRQTIIPLFLAHVVDPQLIRLSLSLFWAWQGEEMIPKLSPRD